MPETNAASNDAKNDIVILHQLPRGYYCPSMSPYPMKVELYLRINKIPYENDYSKPMGPKGKCPWISYNGQDIADSQLIIEFLNEKFNINMNDHLDAEQKAIAKAFRHLMEDHVYWTAVHDRWVKSGGDVVKKLGPWTPGFKGKLIMAVAKRKMKDQCWNQGIGHHSDEEVNKMQASAINAILTFLGSKKYIMGEKICEEDCTIWGFLCQTVYNSIGIEERMKKVHEEYPNLKEYCERIRDEYWTDWDECLSKKPEEKQKEAKQKAEENKKDDEKKKKEKQKNDENVNSEEKEVNEEKPVTEEKENEKPKTEEIQNIEEVKS